MLVFFETPAGYALFKILDEGKLKNVEELAKEFETPDKAHQLIKLKALKGSSRKVLRSLSKPSC
jgi:nucleolar protein 58